MTFPRISRSVNLLCGSGVCMSHPIIFLFHIQPKHTPTHRIIAVPSGVPIRGAVGGPMVHCCSQILRFDLCTRSLPAFARLPGAHESK